jgi:hypothetical protein
MWQEFGLSGIRFDCVSPAPALGVDADTARQTVVAGIATGRFSSPEEVATLPLGGRGEWPLLLEVPLHGARVAHVRVVGIGARTPERTALSQQVPAAVELDLPQAGAVGLKRIGVRAVVLLAAA